MKDGKSQVYERLLILRCQAGDEAALGELIAKYSPGRKLFLVNFVGQYPTADDLLQETWIDAYRKINRLEHPEAFATWLYRIARDKASAELRRRPMPMMQLPEELTDAEAKEPRFSPQDAEYVRAALGELPEEHRQVLSLRFIEVLSYAQIAEAIARPIGTVRSRIHYAKLALRQSLKPKSNGKDLS